ncbi:MAG: serine/threonine-protein phosphatase [Ruminococcus sp.]|nr:serine/threonine-protein phosphatase [Ruminococcus sp.]
MKSDSFVFSYIGGRSSNEDYAQIKKSDNNTLFAVADGLGGHQHGGLASKRAVETLSEAFPTEFDGEAKDWLERTLEEAQSKVLAVEDDMNSTIRTTIVALVLSGEKAAWAHIGDSRLYYIHDNEIASVTEDHSVAYKKFKAGEITYDEIASDEDQSRLLRALGSDRHSPVLDECTLSEGDGFMLCSDGMWEYIYNEEILVDYLKSESAEEWGELMLMRVMERLPEDCDNLSLITVIIQ